MKKEKLEANILLNKKILRKQLYLLLFIVVFIFNGLVFASSPKNNEKKITIKIWDFPRWLEDEKSLDRFSWITRKIKEFEQLHPEAKVELTKLTWQRGNEKLKIAAISGNYPDIAPGTVPVSAVCRGSVLP